MIVTSLDGKKANKPKMFRWELLKWKAVVW